MQGRKCLVLDLDETLVHSSFKVSGARHTQNKQRLRFYFEMRCKILPPRRQPVPNADFIIPVEIEDTVHQVYVLKRPGVDEFMKKMVRNYLSCFSQPH